MKRLLVFSLIVNLALLALTAGRKPNQAKLPAREVRGEARPDASALRQRQARAAARTQSVTPWSQIESRDIRQFISHLRAIGCPEATLRDVVALRVCRAYRERVLKLETELVLKQTHNPNLNPSEWRKLREQSQGLRDEMHSELESVLGEDWTVLSSALTGFPIAGDGLNKILTAEQRAQAREINRQFRHDLDELQRKQMIGGLEPDEAATLRNLERQKRAALAAVLSPPELEEYLYRNSPAADYVRRNLPEAKSEAEYRTMVKLALEMEMSQTLDAPRQNFGMDADTDEAKLESKQRREEFAQQLKELLGEDRIAEQLAAEQLRADAETKAQEEQNQLQMHEELTTIAAEIGVNAESAGRFFDRLKEAMPVLKEKFDGMEKNLSGTPEEKQKQMEAAVEAELKSMAIETMGDKGPAVVEKMMKKGH